GKIMSKFSVLALFSGILFTALTVSDSAQAQTLGSVLNNVFVSVDGVPFLFAGFSYLCGLVLGIMGILKIREHVESPNQVPIWDPIKRFLAGGAFFSLPYMASVVQTTISGEDAERLTGSNYNTGGVSGSGLDAMLVSLMADIWEPAQLVILGFCYLAGIVLLMMGISRLLKSEQDGPRGPMGLGTIMTFLVAGALLSADKLMAFVNGSIFGNRFVSAYASLTYAAEGDEKGHAEAVIGGIFAFVAILGMISFVRGIYMIRQVSEGNSQVSMMAAMTHIIGGSIAINLGAFISVMQETLGISSYGLCFGTGCGGGSIT
ncbi:MAG: hypothetical protein AAF988_04220, partial [Pseudomonadota bacterium]